MLHYRRQSGCFWLLLCCGLACSGTGCTSTGAFRWSGKKHTVASATNPVTQIIPTWQEGEGPGIKEDQVSRGFHGQLYFITQNKGLPAEVKGKVRIYLFDDQGAHEDRVKPIHQFDFDEGAWNAHLIQTKLGPAYSVFVPYTKPGRLKANCVLRIRFTPTEGPTVFSQMVNVELPGFDALAAAEKGADPIEQRERLKVDHQVVSPGTTSSDKGVIQAGYALDDESEVPHSRSRTGASDSLPQGRETQHDSVKTFTIPLR